MSAPDGYDIIGDIHGQAGPLEALLHKLGYRERWGIWRYPDQGRKAIFVGDYIDRNKNARRVMDIVKRMEEHDEALAVMGNHEFNAVAYHTPDPDRPGEYLRPHSEKNRFQHRIFLEEMEESKAAHDEAIAWFRTLPMWLDLGEVRVIHASWVARHHAVVEREADPEAHLPENRFNDGGTDMQGRFWAGTMKDGGEPARQGTFYRLDPDLTLTAWRGGIWTTNGLAFSPDGRRMYFSDSNPAVRTIWACDYDTETGTPGEPAVFFDTRRVAGRPDGGTVDADGCYWQAGVSGWQVNRISPEGELLMSVDMPVEKPTKPMFGGRNLDILFVTSLRQGLDPERPQPEAGSLFAITGLGIRGVEQARFRG